MTINRIIFLFLIYLTIMCKGIRGEDRASKDITTSNGQENDMPLLQSWQNIDKKLRDITRAGVKMAYPIINESFHKMNVSEDCRKDIEYLIKGLLDIKPWAVKFVDYSGKFPTGIMSGSFSSFGAYDDCLKIEVGRGETPGEGALVYKGQYCAIDLRPYLPPKPEILTIKKIPNELKNFSQGDTAVAELSKSTFLFYTAQLRIGACVPTGCSVNDVDKMAKTLGDELSLIGSASWCDKKEETEYTATVVVVITCYCFIAFLVLLGSVIDIYTSYKDVTFKSKSIRVLVAFSAIRNIQRFIAPAPPTNNLNCLYGIRFLGVAWIIAGHTYLSMNNRLIHGLKIYEDQFKEFTSQFVSNGTLSVDTFFFIGGLLVCYVAIKLCKHQKYKFNVWTYIIHRLLRIYPSYTFVLIFTLILPLFGSGPVWHDSMDHYIEACRHNWWSNLLFINNFYDTDHMCFIHFWYMATDFQLYVSALVILIPLLRWPKTGITLAIAAITACIFYSGIVTYLNDYPPTALYSTMDIEDFTKYATAFYFKPYTHVGPYVIGLLAGYLIATKPDLKISPMMQVAGWSFASVATFSVLYGTLSWYREEDTPLTATLLYASLNRTVWTLGVAWMIVCCALGYGGIIDSLLSMRIFVPLGRISFLAYLNHFILQYIFIGNIRTHIQIDRFFMAWFLCGYLTISFVLAFLVYMTIEIPFSNIEKIFLPRPGKETEDAKNEEEHMMNEASKAANGDDVKITDAMQAFHPEKNGKCETTYNL